MKTTAFPSISAPWFHGDRSAFCDLLLGAIIAFAPLVGHAQSELLRNGAFDEVLANWTLPSALAGQAIYIHDGPGGHVNLHTESPGYTGTVLRQNLNISGIANQTMNASLDLKATWPMSGHTIELAVEFSRSDGSITRSTILAPDNSTISDANFTTITGSYPFPADAVRLLALTLDKVGNGNFDADHVSLTSSLSSGTLPMLSQVSPSRVSYGDTVQISGSDFGTTQGSVLIGDRDTGIAIDSWSDSLIEITVSDPCAGGPLSVILPDNTRTGEQAEIGITSPYFTATRFQASGFDPELDIPIAVPGQVVPCIVDVDCHNGCVPVGGITFSIPEAPGAAFHPANISGDGGTCIGIDTSGLTPGLHTFTITANASGFAPRTFPLTIDLRNPGIPTLEYLVDQSTNSWAPMPNPFPLTSQTMTPIRAVLLDDGSNDITPYVDLVFTICNPSVIQVWNASSPWDHSVVMPQDNGSCTITVNGPGTIHAANPVTVSVPESPKIVIYTIDPTDAAIDNSGTSTFTMTVTASQTMTGFSWSNPGGVVTSIDGEFSNENRTYTATLQVNADTMPGSYRLDVSATIPGGGVSRSKLFTVINTPTTGMLTGHQALMRNPSHWHGATGTIEFYDSSTGLMAFERMFPWSESWDYSLPNIPLGTYKLLCKVEQGPGYPLPQWFDNAYNIANSKEVVITAGSTTQNMNFFLDLLPDTLSPVPGGSDPQYNPATHQFQCTAAVEDGFSYELWKSTSFKNGSWYRVASGMGSPSATFTDNNATESKGFYKLIRK